MKFIDERTIKLDKPLNVLDQLVLKFVKILEKYVDYVIISGYVSLLFGRTRGTEDVDFFIKEIDLETLTKLYQDLKKNGFWCLNAESNEEVYSYLDESIAVRFAEKGKAIPNMEVKFARKRLNQDVFTDYLIVETVEGVLKISSLERQIAFKRFFLGSPKDLEDAQHVEEVFKDRINQEKIKYYKELIKKEYGKT